jgi:hypothetical protein
LVTLFSNYSAIKITLILCYYCFSEKKFFLSLSFFDIIKHDLKKLMIRW